MSGAHKRFADTRVRWVLAAALLTLVVGAGFARTSDQDAAPEQAPPTSERTSAPTPANANAPPMSESTSAPADASVEGCWNAVVELPWPAGDTPGELCLQHPETGWEGKFFLKKKWRTLKALTVRGSALTFSVKTPMGKASFEAKHEGNTLRGTADTRLGRRPFRALRK